MPDTLPKPKVKAS